MLGFMDYVQNAFYEASHWDRDNSYGTLTATSRNLLDFDPPNGLRFHVSSLSSPNFATSYTLGSIGLVDGSLSYLYSSLPLLNLASKSNAINLSRLVLGYRQLQELRSQDEPWWWGEIWHQGKRVDKREALLYGRLYLPRSTLEALYLRRLSPRTQLRVSCVSDSRLPNGGTILAHLQHDATRHNTEYIYSTDSALFGVRGLYNFGQDPPTPPSAEQSPDPVTSTANQAATLTVAQSSSQPHGRLSAGGEIYYGLLNKSGGVSTGLRFATLPSHTGFPYTMTVTLNPLMGSLSSTYSVLASPLLALSSRFDFNVYSYESDIQLGAEIWRRKTESLPDDLDWARQKMGQKIRKTTNTDPGDDDMSGCLKARIDQRGGLGVLWEGRVKELLYTCGLTIDLKSPENMIRGFGVEMQYSS